MTEVQYVQEVQYVEYATYSVKCNIPTYSVITIERSYIFKGPQSLLR